MKIQGPWLSGKLIKRYQRFLADVILEDGTQVTAHTPNTGSLKGCCTPGSKVWLRDTQNQSRKYPYSWELVEAMPGVWVGINTGLSNHLVREAIENGVIEPLQGYGQVSTEVRYGMEKSRIDLLLEEENRPPCYVEVKNVTLVEEKIALFPDAVTTRGAKHLRELMEVVRQGGRGVLVFCVQRADAMEVRPADAIDPEYGRTLRQALMAGVEAYAYQANPMPEEICLDRPLPVICP